MNNNLLQSSSFFITIQADMRHLAEVKGFINEKLDMTECSKKDRRNVIMSAEEIFTNICSYAYIDGVGDMTIEVGFNDDKDEIYITFIDAGIPYNPLKKEDPNVREVAQKRRIGGLGIYLTKKLMDNMTYEYSNNENRLKIMKHLNVK